MKAVEQQSPGHQVKIPLSNMSMLGMAGIFLKLGTIGFGGGMAVIAMMENEFVTRRRQFTTDEFLHGVGMAQILGPFAPNAAFFLGYRRYGLPGAVLSVLAFLLPSIVIVILLSFLYFKYHSIPALKGVLAGLGPVVIALVLSAAWSMGRSALKGRVAVVFALIGIAAGVFRINPIWVLLVMAVDGSYDLCSGSFDPVQMASCLRAGGRGGACGGRDHSVKGSTSDVFLAPSARQIIRFRGARSTSDLGSE